MKSVISPLIVFTLLFVSCTQDGGKATAEPAPKTVEEYTEAIIKEMRKGILATDQQLREYPPQQMELPAEAGQPPRSLQLWTIEGNPVKLTATAGGGARTAFYFAGGELFYAARPEAGFIFIDRQMKYWLDEDWKPVQAPEEERRKLQEELLKQAEGYLGKFPARLR